jgi:hypothetical protein
MEMKMKTAKEMKKLTQNVLEYISNIFDFKGVIINIKL